MHLASALRRAVIGGILLAAAPPVPAVAADRAYELVSQDIEERVFIAAEVVDPTTPDGNTVCFTAPEAISEMIPDTHCARRGGSGWSSEWITRPALNHAADDTFGPRVRFMSDDGSRHVFFSKRQVLPEVPLLEAPNPRMFHSFVRAAGETRWVTGPLGLAQDGTTTGYQDHRVVAAASAQVDRILFQTADRVLAADTNSVTDVYEWAEGNGTRLVSRDADGNAVGGTLAGANAFTPAVPGTMSRDGSQIFFQSSEALTPGAVDGVQNVYVRDNGVVKLVSPRRNPANPPAEQISFAGAADDGSVVYLSTSEQLTEEAKQPGPAIYRYVRSSDTLSLAATGTSVTPLAVSPDGSSVFYTVTLGLPQLFVERGGGPTMIGPLFPTDQFLPYHAASSDHFKRALRVSRDGSVAVFVSQSPALVMPDGPPGGSPQVFRWQAGQGVQWLSKPVADASISAGTIGNFVTYFPMFGSDRIRGETAGINQGDGLYGRVLSTDGGTVFFDTPQQLVPEDTNGRVDVYEWQGGNVELVTTGKSPSDSYYVANSADGSTVFFVTEEVLVPQDADAVRDLYAARVGGGFPPPPASTVGETPPGAGAGSAGPPAAPSTTAPEPVVVPPADQAGGGSGPGNDPPAGKVRVLRRDVSVKGRIVSVPVRISGTGDLRVVLRRRGDQLGVARTEVTRGGETTVTVRLSRKVARSLSRRDAVRFAVVVRFTPELGESVTARQRVRVALPDRAGGRAERARDRGTSQVTR